MKKKGNRILKRKIQEYEKKGERIKKRRRQDMKKDMIWKKKDTRL